MDGDREDQEHDQRGGRLESESVERAPNGEMTSPPSSKKRGSERGREEDLPRAKFPRMEEADRVNGSELDLLDNHLDSRARALLECLSEYRCLIRKSCQDRLITGSLSTAYEDRLESEKLKLSVGGDLFTVTGTMKAGKSSTINMIVGKELLPHRNCAETAFPVLIRRCDCEQTVIKIRNFDVWLDLLGKFNTLKDHSGRSAEDGEKLGFLEKCWRHAESRVDLTACSSLRHVYKYMSCLNWFVRECLAAKLDIPWPFLVRIDNLPVIETSFGQKLSDKSSSPLTLLDLPGPNESNQSAFRKMIKEQLNMSTSVILVVDYTQIGSAAAQEMYEDILKTNEYDSHIMKNRLLVFVNKFDEKDDRGMDEAEVKERVSNSLMIEDQTKIVVGSARLACLAMRTLEGLEKKSPRFRHEEWFQTFKRFAFGLLPTDEQLMDENVQKRARELLSASNWQSFNANLQQCSSPSGDNALHAARFKLEHINKELTFQMNLREGELTRSKEQSERILKDVEETMKKFSAANQSLSNDMSEMIRVCSSTTESSCDRFKTAVDDVLEEMFHQQDLVFDDEVAKDRKVKDIITALHDKAVALYDQVETANRTFAEELNARLESHRQVMHFVAGDMKLSLDAYTKDGGAGALSLSKDLLDEPLLLPLTGMLRHLIKCERTVKPVLHESKGHLAWLGRAVFNGAWGYDKEIKHEVILSWSESNSKTLKWKEEQVNKMRSMVKPRLQLAERQRMQVLAPETAQGAGGFEEILHALATSLKRSLEANETKKEECELEAKRLKETLSRMGAVTSKAKGAISIEID
eukprot:759510-Hanusia_phi.AAC.2